ncbi:hypothetical protein [Campylobacter troglodytis]|uniref:hypothetical protein n=1 Tax=Campylobacter troglodytis TaxID=654363 RepID=UPI00115BFCB6|nr:hypothetical protein [Campylobacter troglodytis]
MQKITSIKDEPLNLSKASKKMILFLVKKMSLSYSLKNYTKAVRALFMRQMDFVAKIYFKENNTAHKFQKIKLMTSKNIRLN